MDGHPRQNPAYRPATEKALVTGLFLWTRFAGGSSGSPRGGLDCGLRGTARRCLRLRVRQNRARHVEDVEALADTEIGRPDLLCARHSRFAHEAGHLALVVEDFVGVLGPIVRDDRRRLRYYAWFDATRIRKQPEALPLRRIDQALARHWLGTRLWAGAPLD